MQKDMSEADVRRIVAEEIIPRLEELGVAQDYNADRLQIHYRLRSEVPYNYMQDMDFETMALLSERNLGVPGVNVTKKPVRQYLFGALGAHLIGYVGMPSDLTKLPDINKFNFYDPDMEGKAQIELAMNDYLKGEAGMKILQRDAKGTIIRSETEIVEPKQGANVYLTIDARIQYIVEQALRVVGRGPPWSSIRITATSWPWLPFLPTIQTNSFLRLRRRTGWLLTRTKPIRCSTAPSALTRRDQPTKFLSVSRACTPAWATAPSAAMAVSSMATNTCVAGSPTRAAPTAGLACKMQSKFPATHSSTSMETPPASMRSWRWGTCSVSARNPGFLSGEAPGCRDQNGWRQSIPRRAGVVG